MPGVNQNQLSEDSHLRLVREVIMNPRATTANLIVASVDPSTLTAGQALTITYANLLRPGRKITVTLNDAGPGGLAGTFQINGHRFGMPITENVTVTTTTTSDTVGTTTLVFDQVTSIKVLSLTDTGSGDALTVGISGDGLGLLHPIDEVNDVLSIQKIVSGTEQTPIAISSTSVDTTNHAINHGGAIISTSDIFVVTYLRSKKFDAPGLGRHGVFA
jgi:hypothetical protein